jgi:hypothetical protein
MLDDLRKLAAEAIKVRKRIKADTEKLKEIKNQVVEKSKNRNSSFTIKVDEGSIRIIKAKRLISYILNRKGFNKLDNDTKNNLLKNKLVKIKFLVNAEGYENASTKNTVPNNLEELIEKKERKPFSVSVFLDKKEQEDWMESFQKIGELLDQPLREWDEEMIIDDEAYQQATAEDPYEQLFLDETTPEPSHFTDDDPDDLSDTESEEKGLGPGDKDYVIVEDDDDNYESQEEKEEVLETARAGQEAAEQNQVDLDEAVTEEDIADEEENKKKKKKKEKEKEKKKK